MNYYKVLIINVVLILMLFQLTTFAQEENYEPILKEGNVWTSGCAFGFWYPSTTSSITKFKAKGI